MPKVRAVVDLGLILKRAAVLFDDPSGDRKSEAGAGFLGGEEWIEQALFNFRRNSFPGVGDFET